jgi:hypothetical protein
MKIGSAGRRLARFSWPSSCACSTSSMQRQVHTCMRVAEHCRAKAFCRLQVEYTDREQDTRWWQAVCRARSSLNGSGSMWRRGFVAPPTSSTCWSPYAPWTGTVRPCHPKSSQSIPNQVSLQSPRHTHNACGLPSRVSVERISIDPSAAPAAPDRSGTNRWLSSVCGEDIIGVQVLGRLQGTATRRRHHPALWRGAPAASAASMTSTTTGKRNDSCTHPSNAKLLLESASWTENWQCVRMSGYHVVLSSKSCLSLRNWAGAQVLRAVRVPGGRAAGWAAAAGGPAALPAGGGGLRR